MTSRAVAIIQARIGSSRLPGKSLRVMCGVPMIHHVVNRVKAVGFDGIWLATSLNEQDDRLEAAALELGIQVYRGSEWDVLARVTEAAVLAQAEIVVRVTGDCPLWAPDVGARVLAYYRALGAYGIVTNDTRHSGWPDGLDTEVFSSQLLMEANANATNKQDREHVTPWIRRNTSHSMYWSTQGDWHDLKLSVDDAEDFARVSSVMTEAGAMNYDWAATREAVRKVSSDGAHDRYRRMRI